jgi:CubicO group peptidase (beta-lactamase class C family)
MRFSRRELVTGIAGAGVAVAAGAGMRLRANAYAPPPDAWTAAAAYSAQRRGVSMLAMRDGKVLFEDYPEPGAPDAGWELASGTKSFTGVMAACASADGLLDIDEPVAKTITEWDGDPLRGRITIRQLLSLTSGLKIDSPTGRPEPYAEAIKARAVHAPGRQFEYGPTPFQCFGEVMVRKLKAAGQSTELVGWMQTRIFDPIGVRPVEWRRGSDDNPFLPQGAHFTARDWATFGQWVMDGGRGADPKVMQALFTPSGANPGYGLSWWLLRPGLIGPSPRAGVDETTIGQAALKQDIVMAAGAGFQRLYLIRSQRLVVVRQANRILESIRPRAVKFEDGAFLGLLPGT